jgi:hypothetical protein
MQCIGYGAKRGGRGRAHSIMPTPSPSLPRKRGREHTEFVAKAHPYFGNRANALARSISARRASERNPDS